MNKMKDKCEGTVIIVNGEIIAWFANFNDNALEWCRDNYFGEWLAIPGIKPKIKPLSKEETKQTEKSVNELLSFLNSGDK